MSVEINKEILNQKGGPSPSELKETFNFANNNNNSLKELFNTLPKDSIDAQLANLQNRFST